jgi:hypothetical protein
MRLFFGYFLTLIGVCFVTQMFLSWGTDSSQPVDAGAFPVTTSIFRSGVISPLAVGVSGLAAASLGVVLLVLCGANGQSASTARVKPQITDEMRRSAWYVQVKSEIQGPYTLSQVQEWILEKSLLPDDFVRMGPDAPFHDVRTLSAVLFGYSDDRGTGTLPLTRRESYLQAARAHRGLILMFLVSLPIQLLAPFMGYFGDSLVSFAGELLSLAATAGMAYSIERLGVAMGYSRWIWSAPYLLIGCIPGASLLMLIVLNKLARWHFRSANIRVGLLGPQEDDVLAAT